MLPLFYLITSYNFSREDLSFQCWIIMIVSNQINLAYIQPIKWPGKKKSVFQENNRFIALSPGDRCCGSHRAAVGSAGCTSSGPHWGAVSCPPSLCWLSPRPPPHSLGGALSPPPALLPVLPYVASEEGLQILHLHPFVVILLKSLTHCR